MIRSLILSFALVCAVHFVSAQSPIALELRPFITIEIDSTVVELSIKKSNNIYKVYHPFADQKAIWQNYYAVNNITKSAYIRKNEMTLIPIL